MKQRQTGHTGRRKRPTPNTKPAPIDHDNPPAWLLKYGSDPDSDGTVPERHRIIHVVLDALADGCSLTQAVRAAGKSTGTWNRWEGEIPELAPARAVASAGSYTGAVRDLRAAMRAAREDPKLWVAICTYLERKHPEEFGKVDRLKLTTRQDGPVEHNHRVTYTSEHARPPMAAAWDAPRPATPAEVDHATRCAGGGGGPGQAVGQDDGGR